MTSKQLPFLCIVVLLCAGMIYLGVNNRKLQDNKISLYASLKTSEINYSLLENHYVKTVLLSTKSGQIASFLADNGIKLENSNPVILFPKNGCGGCFIALTDMLLDLSEVNQVAGVLEQASDQISTSFSSDTRVLLYHDIVFPAEITSTLVLVQGRSGLLAITHENAFSEMTLRIVKEYLAENI